MKMKRLIPLSILALLALAGCTTTDSKSNTNSNNNGSDYSYNDPIVIEAIVAKAIAILA